MLTKRWDCHEHRDELHVSFNATVYHTEQGQLCYGERHWDVWLWFPIQFKDRSAAAKWINHGNIAEIQESLSILQVGFRCECMTPTRKPYDVLA